MLSLEKKKELIHGYRMSDHDTGSIQLQIALLTTRINHLNEHFKKHHHDNASKTGLMKLVGRRRRFLEYIKRKDEEHYKELIERLGIRG